MKPKKHYFVFFFIILSFNTAIAQSNKEVANDLNIEAIKLMDQGEIYESIELLLKASKLDPENTNHPYEIAFAYYLNKDFAKSIKILDSLKNSPDVDDLVYQQLGNSYDMNGNREKAIETYQLGINKFPNSGKFHQELGNIAYAKEEYSKAISFWQDGIKADPNYSTNYYKLAKIFSFTKEKIWTLLYGEQFILLEPGTGRTKEISGLIFQTYQEIYDEEINYTNIDILTLTGFNVLIDLGKDHKMEDIPQFPFEGVYAYTFLSSSYHFKDKVDFATISNIRKSFLDFWFSEYEFHKNHQIKLFDYQKLMLDNGVFETYTYWLLSEGNREVFQTWYNQNEEKFNQFTNWFDRNRFQIFEKDSLLRNNSK